MNEIDHSNTKVLLIGASQFPEDGDIAPIPNVEANLNLLKNCFTNSELIGIPDSNITISLNENKRQIEKKLKSITNETRNKNFTLLVYYTGHGILSSEDYQLYLATGDTSKNDLEIDGINIGDFKKFIRRSIAGRKIVILDCCHSGYIIGSMGDMPSKIQAELNGFEGTYVMTSAAADEPSLFPDKNPELPTYFTGKLIEVITEGLDINHEYCSLRDIFKKIENDFREDRKPRPQQSNFNNADQLYFSRNKKFFQEKYSDESAWAEAQKKNTKWAYMDFRKQFPESFFAKQAKQKIYEIEEEELWARAIERNTVSAFYDFLELYPHGKYSKEVNKKLNDLREMDEGGMFQKEEKKSNSEIKLKKSEILKNKSSKEILNETKQEISKASSQRKKLISFNSIHYIAWKDRPTGNFSAMVSIFKRTIGVLTVFDDSIEFKSEMKVLKINSVNNIELILLPGMICKYISVEYRENEELRRAIFRDISSEWASNELDSGTLKIFDQILELVNSNQISFIGQIKSYW